MDGFDLGRGPYVTFIIEDCPKKTPENEPLYLAADLNDWKLAYPDYQFKKNSIGQYELRLKKPKSAISMEYKINRGSWDKVEKERFGAERYNRMYDFAVGDTVHIDIKSW